MRRAGQYSPLCFGLLLAFATPASSMASGLSSVLANAAQALGRSSDEVARDSGRVLGRLARKDETYIQAASMAIARRPGARLVADVELATALRRVGLDEAGPELIRLLDGLDAVGRGAFVDIASEARRAIEVGRNGRLAADDVIAALDRGGPEALTVMRGMPDDDAALLCLEGFAKHGELFADFARRGDDGAVRWLARHGDELDPDTLREILRNPTKYLDEAGNLKEAGRVLTATRKSGSGLRRIVPVAGKVAAAGGVGLSAATAWNLPDLVIGGLEPFIGRRATEILRRLKWPLALASLVALVVLILRAWPWLIWMSGWLAARSFPLIGAYLPARARPRAEHLAVWGRGQLTARRLVPNANRRRNHLTLGVLGLERVGKSTFLVMLNKTLSRVIEGASCRPKTKTKDAPILREMVEEVSHCRPTTQERDLTLTLTWPKNDVGTGGSHDIAVKDAPGEWARSTAPPEDALKLVGFLRGVDGLFVIIDPTGLEGEGASQRLKLQKESLEPLFYEDGLDLGRNFLRSMVLVVTKRDMIDRATLEFLASRPGFERASEVERMEELAGRPALSPEQSRELGTWIVDAMFPGLRKSWDEQLRLERPDDESTPEAGRTRRWIRPFLRTSRPRLEVFSVSLLGPTLGAQVQAYRREVRLWESQGREGERPEMATPLDFDGVDARELDYQNAVGWMIDQLPEGLIHQANGLGGLRGLWYRLSIYRRFPQAPWVVRDRAVSLRRLGAGVAGLVLLFLLGWPLLELNDRRVEENRVRTLFIDAARSKDTPAEFEGLQRRLDDSRNLRTKPLARDLQYFSDMLILRQAMSDSATGYRKANGSDPDRFTSGVAWLRFYPQLRQPDPSWSQELATFRESFDRDFNEIANGTVAAVEKLANPSNQDLEGLERIEGIVNECRGSLPSTAVATVPNYRETRPGYEDKLDQIKGNIAKARSDRRLDEATRRAQSAIKPGDANPGFQAAITIVNDYLRRGESGEPPRSDWRARGVDRRRELVEAYRKWSEPRISESRGKGAFAEIEALASELKQASEPDDEAYRFAQATIERLNLDRVEFATREAEKKIGDGDEVSLRQAETQLRDSTGYVTDILDSKAMDDANREPKRNASARWFNAMVLALTKSGRCDEAINFLAEPVAIKYAALFKVREADIWVEWARRVEDTVPKLLEDPKGHEDAAREVTRFLSKSEGHAEAARDARARVEKLELGKLLPARLRVAIDKSQRALADGEEGAIDHVRRLESDARRVLNNPEERNGTIVESWIDAMIGSYKAQGRHPDAIRFLAEFRSQDGRKVLKFRDEKPIWVDYATWLLGKLDSAAPDDREAAWSKLSAAWLSSGARETFQAAARDGIRKQLEKTLDPIQRTVDQVGGDPGKAAAAKTAIKSAIQELGGWADWDDSSSGPPKARLDRLSKRIEGALFEGKFQAVSSKLSNASDERHFEPIVREIGSLENTSITDDQKKHLSTLKKDAMTRWEKKAYRELRSSAVDCDLPVLDSRVTRYLDASRPFHAVIPEDRLAAVKGVQNWLRDFDETRAYVVTGIRIKGLPPGHLLAYSPYFSIRIRNSEDSMTEIKAHRDYAPAEFRLGSEDDKNGKFDTPREFRWKKGQTIEVWIWQGNWSASGYCFGSVKFAEPYSLPRLALPGRLVSANPKQWDFKNQPECADLQVGLDVQRFDSGQNSSFGFKPLDEIRD